MNAIITFFSAEGTTRRYAEALAEEMHLDLFEIKPVDPYTAADLNWKNPVARCNREKFGKKDVPVVGTIENWDRFDTIFLGFPIWYYGAPNVVNTFCKSYDWAGKKVVVFATSGGSDIGKTVKKLMPYLKGDPEVISAAVYTSTDKLIEDAKRL